jgi:putative phosphotransacetylase
VHMSPEAAAFYGVNEGDEMKLKVGGPCAVTFERVLVRVGRGLKLEVHIDTDEGNACNLGPETPCEIGR